MKNINDIIRKNRIIKYLFLGSGILVFFLILLSFSSEEQKLTVDNLDSEMSNRIPKEFNLNINNSIFEGLNKDKLPYQIKAQVVTKQHSDIYNLDYISARYSLSDGDLQILAEYGVLDEKTKFFTLYKNVQIMFNDLVLTGNKINVNLNSNLAYSDYPVKINFQNSIIKASSFSTDDSNNIINFQGNVVSIFNLEDF